jgi:hypothetical protein
LLGPDTDEDGVNDPCDDDDDDDGFRDDDDTARLDPFLPGGLAAPGTILNDACVKDVLTELESLGMAMPIRRERFPPEQDGYYVRAVGTGSILAANDGAPVGATTVGMEARVFVVGVDRFDSAAVDFWNGQALSYGLGRNHWVRGRDADFTHYGAGAGFVLFFSARRGSVGDWLDGYYLSIILPTTGLPHAECPAGAGAYRFSDAPLTTRVEASELEFMCVDQDSGYVPTERWTRSGGEACECTNAYRVSCTGD